MPTNEVPLNLFATWVLADRAELLVPAAADGQLPIATCSLCHLNLLTWSIWALLVPAFRRAVELGSRRGPAVSVNFIPPQKRGSWNSQCEQAIRPSAAFILNIFAMFVDVLPKSARDPCLGGVNSARARGDSGGSGVRLGGIPLSGILGLAKFLFSYRHVRDNPAFLHCLRLSAATMALSVCFVTEFRVRPLAVERSAAL